MNLITRFSDPTLIEQMSLGEKVSASLFVTALGMIITFCALIVLWGLTSFYSGLVQKAEAKKAADAVKTVAPTPAPAAAAPVAQPEQDDEELVAVISAAVASALGTSVHNIVVKNIVRVPDQTPAWGQSGRIDQMNARF
jgi:sodium pump decarboxylase gamma subunit